jgi:hypothetical protein
MKPPLTFLLSLTFLFLFSGASVVFGDALQNGLDAYEGKDYEKAIYFFKDAIVFNWEHPSLN